MNQLTGFGLALSLLFEAAAQSNGMSLSNLDNRNAISNFFLITLLCGGVLWSTDTLAQQPGSKVWEFDAGGFFAQPAIDEDGNLYLAGGGALFHALDLNGAERWEYRTAGQVIGPASLGPD